MKLEIAGSRLGEVLVKPKLTYLNDGSIALKANDTEILWVHSEGTIMFNSCDGDKLEKMGFKVRNNKVRITNAE